MKLPLWTVRRRAGIVLLCAVVSAGVLAAGAGAQAATAPRTTTALAATRWTDIGQTIVNYYWVAPNLHTIGYSIGFVLLGLGSIVFSYLLYRSRYVPRLLSGLGIVASALLAAGSMITIVVPATTSVVNPALYVPIFLFEVGTGLWLLIKGIR